MSRTLSPRDVVRRILADRSSDAGDVGQAFAPANIALCKYWGKRDETLNLPVTSSLSVSLGLLGSTCQLRPCGGPDQVTLAGERLAADHPFVQRLSAFLDLFRVEAGQGYAVDAVNSIPTAAGFASSASGFASIVLALDNLYGWQLPRRDLSILARLGSGSASRSLWQGFVEWHAGRSPDGMDCHAEPLAATWTDLRVGLLVLEAGKKPIGSRAAMKRTRETSPCYATWPDTVAADMAELKAAINTQDFERLGETAESNALAMHATMITARPPVLYWKPESVAAMHRVWEARRDGLAVYFTMDAGPNLKLLFTASDEGAVRERFPGIRVTAPQA